MEKKDVRIPQQKRSIEKKEKILEAATRIFMEKGYFGTNTADIAREAGISTGSVYAYYKDKKDILMAMLNRFGDTLTQGICDEIQNVSYTDDISSICENVLRIFANYNNNWTKLLHDEVMSLKYIDDDVKNYFENIRKTMMNAITKQLEKVGYIFSHEREQTFLLFQMVMGIEDELAFNHSPDINQDILINECAKSIIPMLVPNEEHKS